MDQGTLGIFIGSLLLLASIFAGLLSARVGAPLLLVFLGLGMLAGEDGPGRIVFDDPETAFLIGNCALVVILFDGGQRTPRSSLLMAWGPAAVLATLGVVITAAVVGGFAVWLLELDWLPALLIGAIVASTDAAAVFMLLGRSGIALRDRVRATLEVESGSNDPMGVFLTITILELMAVGSMEVGWPVLLSFIEQMGLGVVLGLAGAMLLVWLMNRLELSAGLYPILALAGALCIFSSTQIVGGSGYLAVYLAGLVFGNRRVRARKLVGRFFDGMAWLAQIVMFLMLGLLVTPTELVPEALPALAIALVLILLARPLAVLVSLVPFRFSWRERVFISWVGLRGAVPIFLALFPLLAGLDISRTYFNIAFVVVLVSLILQGWTIPWVARLLGVALPPEPEPAPRLDVDLLRHLDRDLVGYVVRPHSQAAAVPLARLDLPRRTRILSVLRGGAVLRLGMADRLRPDDFVLLLTPPEQALPLDRVFSAPFSSTASLLGPDLGDFILEGSSAMNELLHVYDLPLTPEEREQTLAAVVTGRLGGNVGRGDRVRIGTLEFIVVDQVGTEIRRVGIRLEPESSLRRRLRAWSARLRRIGRWRPWPGRRPSSGA